MLAVGALVASLFAVGAAPTAADEVGDDDGEATQSHKAASKACLGDALADRGFTDLPDDDAFVNGINCLAHYGITAGTGDGSTFSPGDVVTRWQMDLFMRAAARVAAVDADDVLGTYATDGDDSDEVTRADMAKLLLSLIDEASGDVKVTDGVLSINGMKPDTFDHFADVRDSEPRSVDTAISAIYELGVTAGTSDTAFSPRASVTRDQMAVFITAALDHTNVRPAGLTAQVAGAQITVSIRDDNFAPVVNQAVDAFKAAAADEGKAFTADGSCSSRTSLVDGGVKCLIDGGDPVTQSDGNFTLATLQGTVGEGLTVWIWAGDLGEKVGTDTTDFFKMEIPKGAEDLPNASSATISTDLAKQPSKEDVMRAHFGTTVTFTIQLQGDPDMNDATDNNVNVGPPEGDPTTYTVVKETFNGDSTSDSDRLAQSTETVTIGSDGSGTFTATAADSDKKNLGNIVTIQYTVTPGNADLAAAPSPDKVVFSDEVPVVTYVSVEVGGALVAPGRTDNAGNAATVTVRDQYGNPFKGAGVVLRSSNPTGENDTDGSTIRTTALLTGSSGTVRIGYSYTGNAAEETLVAMWDGYKAARDLNDDGDTEDQGESPQMGTFGTEATVAVDNDGVVACQSEDVCGHTSVYWVLPTEAPKQSAVVVLSADTDNDQVVVNTAVANVVTPTSVNYDGNDFFTVTTLGEDADVDSPSSLADFETALSKALEPGGSGATLSWSSYDHEDSSDIASFELDVTG